MEPNINNCALRPTSELIKTSEILSGWESQRLRTYCTTECMEPSRDLDAYGQILAAGNLSMVQIDFLTRATKYLEPNDASDDTTRTPAAHTAAAKELFDLRWGPTKVPIYNLLGLFSIIKPSQRKSYLEIARFLINVAKVPVNGADLSGTTALSHSFSTKPGLDFEYAQMLYDAGGDVNNRNRYGGTVGQEIVQVYMRYDAEIVKTAQNAFQWFLDHGGNVDVADTDGCTVRSIIDTTKIKGLHQALEKESRRRAARGNSCCTLCGREDIKLLTCGRCKKATYCQPPGRKCQNIDWPRHKKECKA